MIRQSVKTMIWGTLLLLCSCSSPRPMMTGADRDKHGCIPSAGQNWSRLLQSCIRVFDAGIRLDDTRNPQATSSAFAVFSPDRKNVELFFPDGRKSQILTASADGWKSRLYELISEGEYLCLYRKGILIYQSKANAMP